MTKITTATITTIELFLPEAKKMGFPSGVPVFSSGFNLRCHQWRLVIKKQFGGKVQIPLTRYV